MTTSPLPIHARTGTRIRPVNLGRDTPQLLRLLRQAFNHTLDSEAQRAINNMRQDSPRWLARLNHLGQRIHPGFVYELDGQIVGNVSLLTTKPVGRALVVNVAVSSDYRRQGIARQLMDTSLQHLQNRHMKTVYLQVDVDNDSAIRLYESLGFVGRGSTHYWLAAPGEWHEISSSRAWDRATPTRSEIRPLAYSDWQQAYALDVACQPLDLNWPNLITPDAYRLTILRQFQDFMNGRQMETWTIKENNTLLGIASVWSEWGKPHEVRVRIPEAYRDELARPLFAKLLRRLRYLRRRYVSIEHLDDDTVMNGLLKAAGFRQKRHLLTMKMGL